jgi:hypothetical protein
MAKRRLIDFGGFTAGRKTRSKKRLDTEDMLGMRCQSCGKLNYVSIRETRRAARPRCNACGGNIEEVEHSYKRRTGQTFNGAFKAAKNQTIKPFVCTVCRADFRNEVALRLHVTERHPESRQDVSDAGLRKSLDRRGRVALHKLCQDIRHEEETGGTPE